MITTKEPEDIREAIIRKQFPEEWVTPFRVGNIPINDLYLLMDKYFEARSMELLEWMANNNVDCDYKYYRTGKCAFKYKGEWITREQLFENFL